MTNHLSITAHTRTTILVYNKNHGIFPKLIMVETRPTRYHKYQYLQNDLPYILESPHPFDSFRGLKNQMQIRFAVMSWILEK